jgi:alpha-D-ribose 1-methylphosphonate 5-triphosphate synthase subunit PhnH
VKELTIPAIWRPDVQQGLFRLLLQAFAYPGDPQSTTELIGGDSPAVAALATLSDEEVTFADPHGLLTQADHGFLLGREAEVGNADFVLADSRRTPNLQVKNGTIYRPEESATVILLCASLGKGDHSWRLSGPGIETTATINGESDLDAWLDWRQALLAYPQGVDLILAGNERLIGIPRTTKVEANN